MYRRPEAGAKKFAGKQSCGASTFLFVIWIVFYLNKILVSQWAVKCCQLLFVSYVLTLKVGKWLPRKIKEIKFNETAVFPPLVLYAAPTKASTKAFFPMTIPSHQQRLQDFGNIILN